MTAETNGGILDLCQENVGIVEHWLNSLAVRKLLGVGDTRQIRLVAFEIRPFHRLGVLIEAGLITGNAWIGIPNYLREQIGLLPTWWNSESYVEFGNPR